MSIIRALKWSFLSEITSKAIQPVIFIVLARMLAPDDFGVMSAALMVIAFSQIFWEAGMGKALIQRQTNIEEAANVVFWINIALGIAMAGILYATAAPLAQFIFHDERVTLVVQVMTIQVILGSVSAVHTSLLQKDMSFRKLFWIRFATVSMPGLASIPLAWSGMGYWALVAGTLAGQVMQAIMLWRTSDWRPSWSFDTRIAREIGRFGAWVSLSALLAWFYIWADALIVGMYLGSQELGLYRTGNQVAMMLFGLLFAPISPVLYSHLSRMKGEPEQFAKSIEWIINSLTLIAVPVAFIVFALAEPIEAALFGEKWRSVGIVIGAMALMHGYSWVAGMNGEFYRVMGKPSRETIVTAVALVFYLTAYLISVRFGLEAFVWTRTGLAVVALFLHLLVLRSVVKIRLKTIIRNLLVTSLVAAISVAALWNLPFPSGTGPWEKLMISGLLNTLLVGAAIFVMGRNNVLKELLVRVANRRTR